MSGLGYFWVKVSPGLIIVWPGKAVRDLEACQGHAIVKALSILIGAANVENRKASSGELLPGRQAGRQAGIVDAKWIWEKYNITICRLCKIYNKNIVGHAKGLACAAKYEERSEKYEIYILIHKIYKISINNIYGNSKAKNKECTLARQIRSWPCFC